MELNNWYLQPHSWFTEIQKRFVELLIYVFLIRFKEIHDVLWLFMGRHNCNQYNIIDLWSPMIKSSRSGAGDFYVFSSFPPRPSPQRPPPQRLTSKPFELHLRYLEQRIYCSGKNYWMNFPWPWPKATAVALISKKLLVCTTKWKSLIRSLQNVVALLP